MEMGIDRSAATTVATHPVCGERAYLSIELVDKALEFAAGGSVGPADVERQLRCTLQEHTTGDHFAFVVDLDGRDTGSVWARWVQGRLPASVVVLPDCDATGGSRSEPCCEFDGHPGGHTYELADPWAPSAVTSI
jgi:hypothetical protein